MAGFNATPPPKKNPPEKIAHICYKVLYSTKVSKRPTKLCSTTVTDINTPPQKNKGTFPLVYVQRQENKVLLIKDEAYFFINCTEKK